MKILIINGPNLNMVGILEPEKYGTETLDVINGKIKAYCDGEGIDVEFYQSNHEGDIVDKLHSARGNFDGIVLNAAAYTHYSYAIRDAIPITEIPVIEVHMTNVHSREEFRRHSYVSLAAKLTVSGKGFEGYKEAILYLKEYICK